MGFFCIDNLPPTLILKFLEVCKISEEKMDKVAIVMDIRSGKMLDNSSTILANIEEQGYNYEILFLEAADSVLVKRYKLTRRKHPLALNERIAEGIKKDIHALEKSLPKECQTESVKLQLAALESKIDANLATCEAEKALLEEEKRHKDTWIGGLFMSVLILGGLLLKKIFRI
jgi:RNase adaptor protein for sRNA GlmZ degradation